jgi:hypothetical protein
MLFGSVPNGIDQITVDVPVPNRPVGFQLMQAFRLSWPPSLHIGTGATWSEFRMLPARALILINGGPAHFRHIDACDRKRLCFNIGTAQLLCAIGLPWKTPNRYEALLRGEDGRADRVALQ